MISRKQRAIPALTSLAVALVLFLPTIGAGQTQNNFHQVAHLNKPQVLVFSDGGDDRLIGRGMATDAAGNVYIPSDLGGFHFNNAFGVLKYNSQGKLLGAFHFNPTTLSSGFALDVKVDASGNIYACGFTFPFGGLVMSFDPSGKTRWTRFIGNDEFFSMTLDHSGNIYVGGDSAGAILVAKLTTGGKILWTATHAGATTARALTAKVQLDSRGNLAVIGGTSNSDFLVDTTVLKVNPQGKILWSQDFNEGSGFNNVPQGAVVDQADSIYATGTALNEFSGEAIPYTLKFDTNGNREFLLTGAGVGGVAIAADPTGDIVLHGSTLIAGESAPTVSKIDPTGKAVFVTDVPITGRLVTDSAGNIFLAGGDASGFSVVKLNSEGVSQFTFDRPMPNFIGFESVTDPIFDPFGNLYVAGFGLPNGSGVNDILTLQFPANFE
jgi:sugar lactone lactonase YvrE